MIRPMSSRKTGIGLLLVTTLVVVGSGRAVADPTHRGANLFAEGCKSCHVVTREQTGKERAADGRTVLYQKIKDRSDAALQTYLTDPKAKRPTDCQVVPVTIYQAPLLIAYLRAASRPEPKTVLPIVPRKIRERPIVPGGQTRRAGTSRGGGQ